MTGQIPKSIVVSGSSGGIGSVIAQYFLARGSMVLGVDNRHSEASAQHSNFKLIPADLGDLSGARHVAAAAAKEIVSLDLLINCAGVFIEDAMGDDMPVRLAQLWQNNVASAIYLSQALHPILCRGNNPLVVMISSADAVVASGGQSCEVGVGHDILYATTKGALLTFTRALAMKWAPKIRVNAICPTIVRSPMSASLLTIPGKENELASHIPLRRIAEPMDVAEAIAALYTLKMTTGHVLPVDGGYLCQ